ncbi:F-box protein At1g11270-like [Salvia hispanica]|uniref:F-box protein At1g11270-like n=1 Tax=Salvia hispanica TaxID=49212 RepID=UPI00200961CF|nr:F-box protein At1g11270-like [Salvia hispanica]
MNHINGFDFFGELPLEITIDILSRLPIGTVIRSKLVSKAWRDAIKSHEFVEAHRLKGEHKHEHDTFFVGTSYGDSVETSCGDSEGYKLLEGYGSSIPTTTTIPCTGTLAEYKPLLPYSSSVMGLMLLFCPLSEVFSICNPVTREYVRVPLPPSPSGKILDRVGRVLHFPKFHVTCFSYGIGLSNKSKQYKLVYIRGCYGCHIYTLGTGQWRVGPSPPKIEGYSHFFGGGNWASLDGKLYWVKDKENICSFDLESEVFTTFSAPLCARQYLGVPVGKICYSRRVCFLEERLCVCDVARTYVDIVMLIWTMRGEGDWRLLCTIRKDVFKGDMYMSLPIKVLDKGNKILMASSEGCGERYCYDINNTSITQIGYVAGDSLDQQYTYACPFNPTFVPLKTLFQHQDKDIIHSF